jgi:hypothetical protein
MRRILLFCLLPLAPLFSGETKQGTDVQIRLHAEGQEQEGETFVVPVTLTNPPKQTFVRKVPIVTERDIVAFYPFAAHDGTIGCYFKLDADGGHKLHQHTVEKLDTLVVAMINGRVACAMMVDKQVKDGILPIPSGFMPIEIAKLQTKFPIMGKEKEFDEQKKKALAALKEAQKNAPKPTPKPKEKK